MAILSCTCKYAYQDSKYGKGMRVHNSCVKGYRCTVCSNVKTSGNAGEKQKK